MLACVWLFPLGASADEQLLPGALQEVAELSVNPGNLAVTADGRVFATVHPFRRADAQLIEITGPQGFQPWPDAAWNGPFGSGPEVLDSPPGTPSIAWDGCG